MEKERGQVFYFFIQHFVLVVVVLCNQSMGEDVKSAKDPKCRQYKSTACFLSSLFACLPSKMYLVMTKHI
jgi:hypothetical protein